MSRCGCGTTIVNDTCACALGSSDSVTVTGSGNVGDPYIPAAVLDPALGNTLGSSAAGLYTAGMLEGTSADRGVLAPGAAERVLLYETDTDLLWKWDGAAWQRVAPSGWLGGASRTTFYVNDTTSFTTVVGTGSIHVPDGLRPIKVTAAWPDAGNDAGPFRMVIRYTLADGTGDTGISEWSWSGDLSVGGPGAGNLGSMYVGYIRDGLPEGDYKFQLKARNGATTGGTTVFLADDPPDHVTIDVEEA